MKENSWQAKERGQGKDQQVYYIEDKQGSSSTMLSMVDGGLW